MFYGNSLLLIILMCLQGKVYATLTIPQILSRLLSVIGLYDHAVLFLIISRRPLLPFTAIHNQNLAPIIESSLGKCERF